MAQKSSLEGKGGSRQRAELAPDQPSPGTSAFGRKDIYHVMAGRAALIQAALYRFMAAARMQKLLLYEGHDKRTETFAARLQKGLC